MDPQHRKVSDLLISAVGDEAGDIVAFQRIGGPQIGERQAPEEPRSKSVPNVA